MTKMQIYEHFIQNQKSLLKQSLKESIVINNKNGSHSFG